MNARQRKAQHARRRRHQAATRSPSGQGMAAGLPPGARPLRRGKTQPTERRLRTVHDMANVARHGRDDAERAWRRAFKGIHAIGYKSDGSPSAAGGLQQMTPLHPEGRAPNHRSGSQKRKQRGRRRILPGHPLSARLGDGTLTYEAIGVPELLSRCGWVELRSGLWSRDHDRILAWAIAQPDTEWARVWTDLSVQARRAGGALRKAAKMMRS